MVRKCAPLEILSLKETSLGKRSMKVTSKVLKGLGYCYRAFVNISFLHKCCWHENTLLEAVLIQLCWAIYLVQDQHMPEGRGGGIAFLYQNFSFHLSEVWNSIAHLSYQRQFLKWSWREFFSRLSYQH